MIDLGNRDERASLSGKEEFQSLQLYSFQEMNFSNFLHLVALDLASLWSGEVC